MSVQDSLIAGENVLDSAQRELLRWIAAAIIPSSSEYGVPGADDARIFADILATARPMAAAVVGALGVVADIVSKYGGGKLQSMDDAAGTEVLKILRATPAVFVLVSLVLRCYYRDDRVMRSLDMEPRAPFPDGFEVEQGNWSLLDPVRQRGRRYRDVP
ncbi:MAG: hypothetical protein R3E82_10535 [Pseudomonadales bacterium]